MFLSWRWISSKNRIQIAVPTAADKISSAGHHRIADEPGARHSLEGIVETSGAVLTRRVLSAISGAGKPSHRRPQGKATKGDADFTGPSGTGAAVQTGGGLLDGKRRPAPARWQGVSAPNSRRHFPKRPLRVGAIQAVGVVASFLRLASSSFGGGPSV